MGPIELIISALIILIIGSGVSFVTALFKKEQPELLGFISAIFAGVSGVFILIASIIVFSGGIASSKEALYTVPVINSSFSLHIDNLSAVFLFIIGVISILSTLYSIKFMAIAFYKKFVTHYIMDRRDPKRSTYDNLETVFKEAIKTREEASDWVLVRGMSGDGKYAYRNDNCLWVDAMEDLPDPELKYYVCCYGDYESSKVYHDSIILTMEHTIARGDPYCSRVLHDTRVDWDLKHPPKDFWDSMKPENE